MRRRVVGFMAAVVALMGLAIAGSGVRAEADPGDLDGLFSGDGIVEANLSSGFDLATAVQVQPDGKIVVAGRAGGSGGRMFVARYASNGTLDPSFSGDGRAYVNFTAHDDAAFTLAIHVDGRIVLAGGADGLHQVAMARFAANGTLDPSFSGDGKATFNLRGGASLEGVEGLVITASERYRLVGLLGRFAAVLGVGPGGSLDSTWSGDGQLTVPFSGTERAIGTSIAEGSDGTITIAGSITGAGAQADRTIIARFLAGGGADVSFSGDGRNSVSVVDGYEDATALVVLDDGATITAGEANGQLSVLKWQADGTLDPAFTGDGKLRINLSGGPEWISDFERLDDGSLVLAGRMAGSGGRAFVARLDDAGQLDATFSGNGVAEVDRGPQQEWARSLDIDGDGNIVAAGSSDNDDKVLVFRVVSVDPF